MKDKVNYLKVTLVIMWIAIIGLLVLNVIENKNVNPNGFDISKKNFNDIKNYAEDNNIKGLSMVDMETGKVITLYSLS